MIWYEYQGEILVANLWFWLIWAKKLKTMDLLASILHNAWAKSFKITVFQLLFSYVHGFWPKKYLSTLDFGYKHNKLNIYTIFKYGNFLHSPSHSQMHLVQVHSLFNAIWTSFEWKQAIQRLLPPQVQYYFILSAAQNSIIIKAWIYRSTIL